MGDTKTNCLSPQELFSKGEYEALFTFDSGIEISVKQIGEEYFVPALQCIDALCKLEKECKWIPIENNASNPMPEENKVYLVTYETIHGKRYVRDLQANYVGETPRYIGWSKKINGEVIAWMPLPEPYKADREVIE